MNIFRCLFQRGMSAGELRVRLDQIHQSLHLAIINSRNYITMATQDSIDGVTSALGTVSDTLQATGDQLAKGQAEIVAEIAALQNQPAGTPPDFTALNAKVAALSGMADALKAQAQALDDMNPDTPAA